MYDECVKTKNTIIIFFPFELKNIERFYIYGDIKSFDNIVKLFFVTSIIDCALPKTYTGLFKVSKWNGKEKRNKHNRNWIYAEINQNVFSLKKFKIQNNFQDINHYHIIWINYNFKIFSQYEILSFSILSAYCDKSYFKHLKEKVNEKVNNEKIKKISRIDNIKYSFTNLLSIIVLKLTYYSAKSLPVTKYFNIALHINGYLAGFQWALKSVLETKKINIKVMNLLLSVLLDMILGILFLKWVNSKVSLNSSPTLFLLTAESVVNSIKDLINWLRGDPAGLKLNWAFNKVLATFFSFHIDIWWTFITYLKPLVPIIFQIFLKLGLLGVTFQASIIADLLALVSFHVYCIYAYAAKLYSIQLSALKSLWRLFLGRKKNPLREKVDSCKYSPEQLFVGTLGFTILLFLLPTTLLYYIVFTSIRLLVLTIGAFLAVIRCLNQILPVYSSILWLVGSKKVAIGLEIMLPESALKSNIILLKVEPILESWWETITYFTPDCVTKPPKLKLSEFLSSLINGKPL